MASSSYYTLSLPLPSSARLGLRALKYGRRSRSAPFRLQTTTTTTTTTTKGLRSGAATSYQNEEEAGHGDNGNGIAATTSALHLVAGDDDAATELIREEARVRGGALSAPKPPGEPWQGSGGSGGKVHAAPPTLLGLPKEKEPAAKAEAVSINDDE